MNTITRYFRTLLTYYFKALPINKRFMQVMYACHETLKEMKMKMALKSRTSIALNDKKTGGIHPALSLAISTGKINSVTKKDIHSKKNNGTQTLSSLRNSPLGDKRLLGRPCTD